MKRVTAILSAAGAVLVGCLSSASAADVTFGTPTYESSDSDIATNGTLVYAYNFTSDGSANATINGVTFQALSNGANGNVFTDYQNSYNGFGSSNAPFANLSPGYQTLLGSAYYDGQTNLIRVQNLTVGNTYEFEYFVDDSRNLGGVRTQYLTGGNNSVLLNLNGSTGSGSDGSLGQFVIGTFVADAGTQSFSVSGTPQSNGFELRDITAVPEPITYPLFGLGAACFVMTFRRMRASYRTHGISL